MAIINERWPIDLAPKTCVFGRTRNDAPQISPVTRKRKIIRRGRPLWSAKCTWELPNTERLARLRFLLESLDGFNGSAQLWDFASPYPAGLTLATPGDVESERLYWTHLGVRSPWTWAGMPSHWTAGATVSASAGAAGATSVTLSGLAPNSIAAVQGQYVQIGRRLYLAAAGAMSDAGGVATVQITPGLISAVSAGTTSRLVFAACEMQLAEQDFDSSATAGDGAVSISATFIESVEDVTA